MRRFAIPVLVGALALVSCVTSPTEYYVDHKFYSGDIVTNDLCTATILEIYNHKSMDEVRYKVKDLKCGDKEYFFGIIGETGFRVIGRFGRLFEDMNNLTMEIK